jgi:PTS system nitrogen regulatory IIA component
MNTPLDILTADRIIISGQASNRAEAFAIAGNLFENQLGISSSLVVDCLNTRENLSSTSLGSGVAIPHGIVAGIELPIGCFIKLASAIDFAAPDRHKVSILIFLLFPDIPTFDQLQILSYLAQQLLDVDIRKTLISEQCSEKICQLLNFSISFEETLLTQESHSGYKQYITSSNQDIQNYLEEWAILAQRPMQSLH